MRVLLQRVRSASVVVNGDVTGAISQGLLALVGIGHDDTSKTVENIGNKVLALRIFEDDAGKMNRSLLDLNNHPGGRAELLAVSQFTLYGDIRKGRRPSFTDAAQPAIASELVDHFAKFIRAAGIHVETGVFGAHMLVTLVNDGPVTIWIDSADLSAG
jgi:D-tyrosyl-tRNA(Tyr) deacylase